MNEYQKSSGKPIIFGEISGLPYEYNLKLAFKYHMPNNMFEYSLIEIEGKENKRNFSFFVEDGKWTLVGIEFHKSGKYNKQGVFKDKEEEYYIKCNNIDSLEISFETIKNKGHYLGNWKFSGLENVVGKSYRLIEKFKRKRDYKPISGDYEFNISYEVNDEDSVSINNFYNKNKKFKNLEIKKSFPTNKLDNEVIQFHVSLSPEKESKTKYHNNNWLHKEMMKPQIPKY